MRIGPIQKIILNYVDACGGGQAHIGPGIKSPVFNGYSWGEVDVSLQRLLARKILVKDRVFYKRNAENSL